MSTMVMNRPAMTRGTVRRVPEPANGSVRMRLTRRGRIVVVTLAALLGFGIALSAERAVATSTVDPVSYETVYVAPGESLWSIASGIAGERDVRDVVAALEELNGLTSSQLQVGQELLVPADGF
ncbi:LysM peptidoglycan-binding domain-containing protein [Salana multivorans]|uniref:LysM peptidoglycan-binding domain-containing protein n=1 Tax=Salana multivorans TaxID=120377 RepID=UPI000ACA60B8|nr:LysM peptidoglycan-binding domain-containing protein [Salana multivorans]